MQELHVPEYAKYVPDVSRKFFVASRSITGFGRNTKQALGALAGNAEANADVSTNATQLNKH